MAKNIQYSNILLISNRKEVEKLFENETKVGDGDPH